MSSTSTNSYLTRRPMLLGLAKLAFLGFYGVTGAQAAPLGISSLFSAKEEEGKSPEDASLWLYLSVAAALVLLGGAFAGLTIALMGQVSFESTTTGIPVLTMETGRNVSTSHASVW